MRQTFKFILLIATFLFVSTSAFAKVVRYELTVAKQKINMSGKKEVDFALTVNGGIPAPTLEFTEGDDAEILVKNEIPGEEVSIHWHGILLPPLEDGVAYVNTPPIHSGTSRLFKFKIRQNGTFWYHSHTAVQEQKGVYGAFIIHPKKKAIQYDKDVVVVLSDWSDENADQIIRNLRKDGDYYLFKKDSVRSYYGAAKAGGLKTHLSNEWDRMGGMDLSDVGYDAFLINGKRDSQLAIAHPGDRVRIRIINAAASSYFYVSMGGLPMKVISADGMDVEPIETKEIIMGMAETYDILFTPPEHKNYELRATVQDVTGYASGWIGMGQKVPAADKPYPDLYASMDHMGHGGSAIDHSQHQSGNAETGHAAHTGAPQKADSAANDPHAGHSMPQNHQEHKKAPAKKTETSEHDAHADHSMPENHDMHSAKPKKKSKQEDHSEHMAQAKFANEKVDFSTQSDAALKQNATPRNLKTSKTLETLSVDNLRALAPTNLPKDKKVHDLKLVLGGDMERYIWHINGKAIHQDRNIYINEGEVVRFTFVNDTMMHHPMHLHGHFFRVVNENGEYSPLKHTVDVPPHGTRTIEFYSNEPGQWMLHCHNLYHMKTGMGRVVKYMSFKPSPEMAMHDKHDPHLHDHLYYSAGVDAFTNVGEARLRLSQTWDTLDIRAETKKDDKEWEKEADIFYRRWFNNFTSVIVGGAYAHEETRAVVGIGYLLPMLIETNILIDSRGKGRLDLGKRFQWTKTVFSDAEVIFRDGQNPDWTASLMYGNQWNWSAGFKFTEDNAGVGFTYRF